MLHQLRDFLAHARTMPVVGTLSNRRTEHRATVCYFTTSVRILTLSDPIEVYEMNGINVLLKLFNATRHLKSITDVSSVHNEIEAAWETAVWC